MSRDFGITDPKYIECIRLFKKELKRKPQSFWDDHMEKINKICSDITKINNGDLYE